MKFKILDISEEMRLLTYEEGKMSGIRLGRFFIGFGKFHSFTEKGTQQ